MTACLWRYPDQRRVERRGAATPGLPVAEFTPHTVGCYRPARPEETPGAAISTPTIKVAVVGAHLSGMPLNTQLGERHAVLLEQTTTSANYRLFALPNTTPPKPGLKRAATGEGEAIIVEVWEMPASAFGSLWI